MTLPNFLVVGANRSGTTALHNFLAQHPDVFMSHPKEPSYFAWIGNRSGSEWPDTVRFNNMMVDTLPAYEALFSTAGGHRAIGESSTAYLHNPEVPARIKNHLPDVRMIAILRDPADRAFSNYSFYRTLRLENARTFRKALGKPPEGGAGPHTFGERYVSRGFYAGAVRRYFETFGRERVRIYLYEDWTARPRDVLADVFRFLEVDDSFILDVSKRHNEATFVRSPVLEDHLQRRWPYDHPHPPALVRLLRAWNRRGILESRFSRLWPSDHPNPPAFVRRLRARNRRLVRLRTADRKMLIDVYRKDVIELQRLLDRDLSAWLRT